MMNIEEILAIELWGNTLENLLIAAGVFIVVLVGLRVFRKVVLKRLEKLSERTETDLDNRIVKILENISSLFYWFLALYLTIQMLQTGTKLNLIFDRILIVLVVWEVIKLAQNLFDYGLQKTRRQDETVLHGIQLIVKITLWATGLLLVLSNWGINISALAASLGIGGIAIALAAQNILGDLFASFTIYFDKPFRIGDFIILGTDKGTVKKIGLKTTRIETLQGEELVVSNKELTETRVQNYKKMKRRRIDFMFGVVYETSTSKLKKIPEIVHKIIGKQKLADPLRVHFAEFGNFSLNFKVAYYVNSQDYDDYMNTQQAINLSIKEQFEKEGIEMAFPTQTLYVKKDS